MINLRTLKWGYYPGFIQVGPTCNYMYPLKGRLWRFCTQRRKATRRQSRKGFQDTDLSWRLKLCSHKSRYASRYCGLKETNSDYSFIYQSIDSLKIALKGSSHAFSVLALTVKCHENWEELCTLTSLWPSLGIIIATHWVISMYRIHNIHLHPYKNLPR